MHRSWLILTHFLVWLRYAHIEKNGDQSQSHYCKTIIIHESYFADDHWFLSRSAWSCVMFIATVSDKKKCAICWRWWSGSLTWALSNLETTPWKRKNTSVHGVFSGQVKFPVSDTFLHSWSKTIRSWAKGWSHLSAFISFVHVYSKWLFGDRFGGLKSLWKYLSQNTLQ